MSLALETSADTTPVKATVWRPGFVPADTSDERHPWYGQNGRQMSRTKERADGDVGRGGISDAGETVNPEERTKEGVRRGEQNPVRPDSEQFPQTPLH